MRANAWTPAFAGAPKVGINFPRTAVGLRRDDNVVESRQTQSVHWFATLRANRCVRDFFQTVARFRETTPI